MEFDWSKAVKEYEKNRVNSLPRNQPRDKLITNKIMKNLEHTYNPVTQRYRNKETEDKQRQIEENAVRTRISTAFDKQLQYEQTINFINKKDKLALFVDHKDYPVFKEEIKKKNNSNKSNIPYISWKTSSKEEQKVPLKKIRESEYKDYDIITNKYNLFHHEKSKIDNQVYNIEAALKYKERAEFDIVSNRFYDKELEAAKLREEKERIENKQKHKFSRLPESVRFKGMLYNPVNGKVIEEKRLNEFEQAEAAKKARYKRKIRVEDKHRKRNQTWDEELKKKNFTRKREDLSRRSLDFVSWERVAQSKPVKNDWDKIIKDEKKFDIYKGNRSRLDLKKDRLEFIETRQRELEAVKPFQSPQITNREPRTLVTNTPIPVKVDKQAFFKGERSFKGI